MKFNRLAFAVYVTMSCGVLLPLVPQANPSDLMDEFHAQKDELMASLKQGEISVEEFQEQIMELGSNIENRLMNKDVEENDGVVINIEENVVVGEKEMEVNDENNNEGAVIDIEENIVIGDIDLDNVELDEGEVIEVNENIVIENDNLNDLINEGLENEEVIIDDNIIIDIDDLVIVEDGDAIIDENIVIDNDDLNIEDNAGNNARALFLSASGLDTLDVDVENGTLEINGEDVGQITFNILNINFVGLDPNVSEDEAIDNFLDISLEAIDNVAVLRAKELPDAPFDNVLIDVLITTPSDLNLIVRDDGGATDITNMNGEMSVEDEGGSIDIIDSQGELTIVDEGASVNIENFIGNMTISDEGGSININDSQGDFTLLEDGGGSVRVDGERIREEPPFTITIE